MINTNSEKLQMRLYLDNYRGFQNVTINIKDVNFLVGENSSGKTSFLKALNLLSSQAFWMPGMGSGKENADLGHFDDSVSVSAKDKKYFSIGFCERRQIREKKKATQGARGFLFTYRNNAGIPDLYKITYNDDKNVITAVITAKTIKFKKNSIETPLTIESIDNTVFESWAEEHKDRNTSGFQRLNISIASKIPLFVLLSILSEHANADNDIEKSNSFFHGARLMENLTWIAPIRTKPRRTYDEAFSDFSPEGEHTPYLVRKILDSGKNSERFVKFVRKFGGESGLFKEVKVHKFGKSKSSPFELDIVLEKSPLNISNVGYGVSQALPVIVEIFEQKKDTWFAIQQPEVHLHPRAQASFGEIIFEVSEAENKHFLIETHSDFTIDRYRICRRENESECSAQIIFFERKGTKNVANEITIKDNGEIEENSPQAYREFFLREELRVLGAL